MCGSTWLERKVNWIAASDDLPKKGHGVLATDVTGRIYIAYVNSRGKWMRISQFDDKSKSVVTHWMEYPNPPAQFELMRVNDLLDK